MKQSAEKPYVTYPIELDRDFHTRLKQAAENSNRTLLKLIMDALSNEVDKVESLEKD